MNNLFSAQYKEIGVVLRVVSSWLCAKYFAKAFVHFFAVSSCPLGYDHSLSFTLEVTKKTIWNKEA